jgi:hypothetical protein
VYCDKTAGQPGAEGASIYFGSMLKRMMGAGLSVLNESEVDVLVVLSSQVTPLYWTAEPLKPGEHRDFDTGKVWFTVPVCAYNVSKVPTIAMSIACTGR